MRDFVSWGLFGQVVVVGLTFIYMCLTQMTHHQVFITSWCFLRTGFIPGAKEVFGLISAIFSTTHCKAFQELNSLLTMLK